MSELEAEIPGIKLITEGVTEIHLSPDLEAYINPEAGNIGLQVGRFVEASESPLLMNREGSVLKIELLRPEHLIADDLRKMRVKGQVLLGLFGNFFGIEILPDEFDVQKYLDEIWKGKRKETCGGFDVVGVSIIIPPVNTRYRALLKDELSTVYPPDKSQIIRGLVERLIKYVEMPYIIDPFPEHPMRRSWETDLNRKLHTYFEGVVSGDSAYGLNTLLNNNGLGNGSIVDVASAAEYLRRQDWLVRNRGALKVFYKKSKVILMTMGLLTYAEENEVPEKVKGHTKEQRFAMRLGLAKTTYKLALDMLEYLLVDYPQG